MPSTHKTGWAQLRVGMMAVAAMVILAIGFSVLLRNRALATLKAAIRVLRSRHVDAQLRLHAGLIGQTAVRR